MSSVIAQIESATEKISVLLVDDQAMVAEGVRRMLATDPAIAFHYVNDARQALEAAERIGPTVILQDLVMPGVDGFDLLKVYRSNPRTQAIPVIVLSSKEEPAIKQAAFESGANDYVVKLPHRIELLARVRLHSGVYILGLQRQRSYQALEASQLELTQKNSELLQLNDKLEEATRFKSEFFANVSHELRTPLNGVIGMAEILADTKLDIHQREVVEIIRSSGITLLYIINDILDMSKIESGMLELELIPFVLRDAVDQAFDLVAPMAFAKGLEISAWIHPKTSSMVVGDITRVRQVLLNLLNNAIKFTSNGEVYIEVEPSADDPNLIHFWVGDTGIGIPAEKLDRLFRPFSQVDASTNRRFGGTGLGLAICRNLTAMMGGRIWVESIIDQGTQFHFVISLPATEIAESGHADPDLHGKRGLALVQNVRLIRLLAAWAEELALELIVRSNQLEGLADTQLDYLIIDADHCEIQIPRLAQTKVIILTRSKISEFAARYPDATVLLLPLKKQRFLEAVESSADPDLTRSSGSVPEPGSMLSGLNILLVDDNAVDRRVCVAQLQKLGVRGLWEADGGRRAIESARSQEFDLILMDVQMPEIDGFEATQQIRLSAARTGQPRIVGLTANALSEERDRCFQAGMDDQLIKPVRVDELTAVLQETGKIVARDRNATERVTPTTVH